MISNVLTKINTVTRNSLIPKGYFVSKSGLILENFKGNLIFIGGFSVNKNKRMAEKISKYEVLERCYCYYDFHLDPNKKFKLINYFNSKVAGELNIQDVLIGPLPDGISSKDSNGVAFHFKSYGADKNAIFEVIERHILYKIWYGDWNVIKIYKKKKSGNKILQIRYTCFTPYLIPFALSIIKMGDVLVYGSAVRSSFQEAIQKADNEAYMILDGILRRDMGICNSERTRKKLQSLRNSYLARKREKHFNEKIINKKVRLNLKKKYSIREIIANLGWKKEEVSITRIYESHEGSVSRAIIKNAISVLSVERSDKVPDPFS